MIQEEILENGFKKVNLIKTSTELNIKNEYELISSGNEYEPYYVSTNIRQGSYIGLMKEADSSSEIITKIENGTKIYVLKEEMDIISQEQDDHTIGKISPDVPEMVRAILPNGDNGFVDARYLEKIKKKEKQTELEILKNITIDNKNKFDGVLGINVDPNTMKIGEFEELISKNTNIESADISLNSKVNYVYIKMGESKWINGELKIENEDIQAENGYYFFNNGYGFSGYRFIKRRDRKIASIHRSSLLYYIVNKYEIKGYTKHILDDGRYDYYEVEFIKNDNE